MSSWERPQNVPYPSIWNEFEVEQNGLKRKYWVQDLTEEYINDCIHHMSTQFLNEEPLCKYSKFTEEEASIQEFIDVWKDAFTQRVSVVCLTKNEEGKIQIAGYNVLSISCKGDNFDLSVFKGKATLKVMSVLKYTAKLKDPFNEFNTDKYLTAFGLFVLPEFRGASISMEILKARRNLCKAIGVKVSITHFTSIISQKTATKAGFQNFLEISYDDLEKINPELFSLPGITDFTKSLRYMYNVYD